ncbi:hypothetical protein [Nitrosomonas sp.]|uniref:hypothetical protein n=1 Tax=Nitrosomonas sp. TaxID=42353 RepID=UPI0020806D75|nr:hypothetical protein [Nitrosomonas sp.]GJL76451.1 MAG: hypothetical protein NMNS02_25570 [Nitrosomonas sp.]
MNSSQTAQKPQAGLIDKMRKTMGLGKIERLTLEVNEPPANRGNRLCVSVSDIHLTDGTVGFQNLNNAAWNSFFDTIKQRCIQYAISELVFVLDGDVVDMIRSSKWAAHEPPIYPWERNRKEEFSAVVNAIIKDVVENQHAYFFHWLRELENKFKQESQLSNISARIVIMIGNHDKELFCDPEALKYFYEKGLGRNVSQIPEEERRMLGRMYGDETMFLDPNQAPYLPFYYGDTGFRFFVTHGQWRDEANSRRIKAENGRPGWKVANGWQIETWQQLKFSPFFEPCFGDSVAAGVLSTFIYKAKKKLNDANCHDPRLGSILDELDLYRPTYAAVNRILEESAKMREQNKDQKIIDIIENTLYECILEWLSWDFTYQSSPALRKKGLKLAKRILEIMKSVGHGLEIKSIAALMRILAFFDSLQPSSVKLSVMKKFPSFLPVYRHYNFQIHGEGHTHKPLQEEPNLDTEHPITYINFGTWRDQIISRKKNGYRRRGILRALFILDIVNYNEKTKGEMPRTFDYFVEDIVHWSDAKDALDVTGHIAPRL